MGMLTVSDVLADGRLFAGLRPDHLELVAGCARLARFPSGALLLKEGQPADRFYVVRSGHVALQVQAPGRGALSIQTLGAGDAVGWSWLFPPYRWQLDAVAREPVAAVVFDGACLRGKCDQDHELGYQMMSRFSQVMLQHLIATRLQLIDVYGRGTREAAVSGSAGAPPSRAT
jgi:CRP/FNR family transcriptional regulator, cyclic AMP receptor protein